MNVDMFLLIIWAVCGILTITSSLSTSWGDRMVPLWSYILCWIVLMMELAKGIAK